MHSTSDRIIAETAAMQRSGPKPHHASSQNLTARLTSQQPGAAGNSAVVVSAGTSGGSISLAISTDGPTRPSRADPNVTTATNRRAKPSPHVRRLLLYSGVLAAATFIVWFGLLTVGSLYKAPVNGHVTPPRTPAVASVLSCTRSGPIGSDGFGRWWICDVTITVRGGRTVKDTVSHSIVIPSDIGHLVDFVESCAGSGHTDCSYGRPTRDIWEIANAFISLLRIVVTAGLALVTAMQLLQAILVAIRTLPARPQMRWLRQ